MDSHFDPGLFRPALIILTAAAVVIPLFHRLRLSPVLGFMLVGVAVGPFGIASFADRLPLLRVLTLADPHIIAPTAELGVSLLMFMIGLELSLERLRVMRRLVFGLGLLQFLLCGAAIAGIAYALGASIEGAAVVGAGLAMSSTAVVLQVLSQEKRLGGPLGRVALAILLFQDIAAVPVLFIISLLGENAAASGFTWTVEQAIATVLGLIVAGRLVLRPLFRSVARTGSPELFVAACLLVVLATGLATMAVRLPMELGSLIAGLLLAETEFRRQIELTIDPFKGLFVGVFLISVGMSLDPGHILTDAPKLLAAGVVLVAVKLVLIACLTRAFGLRWSTGGHAGLLLGAGGEFGFVIFELAGAEHVIGPDAVRFPLLLTAVSMASIPLLSALGRAAARRVPASPAPMMDPALLDPIAADPSPRVILAGFGRVGETVAEMLDVHRQAYVAVDKDPDRVAAVRRVHPSVFWGDLTREDLLHRLHIDTAKALVVTMSDHAASDRLVAVARALRPDLLIVARARDARHAAQLYRIGVTDAVPETIEASLQLSEAVLVDLGVPMGPVIATIHEKRAAMQAEIRAMTPGAAVKPLGRRRLRDVLGRAR
ncbi:MAG TPA: cation:proton antiporter [Acetobacteraceae bacterium]|nr:cation:proton antiporter [Acetobacteraceae bacterium]